MPRQAAPKLGDMTVAQLLQLRDKVQTALSSKIKAERQELERKINLLSTLGGPAPRSRRSTTRGGQDRRHPLATRASNGKTHPLNGRTVAPKYRDPADPSQTWAGRGQAPRWLIAYENQGRKRDAFLIGASPAGRGKRRRRK